MTRNRRRLTALRNRRVQALMAEAARLGCNYAYYSRKYNHVILDGEARVEAWFGDDSKLLFDSSMYRTDLRCDSAVYESPNRPESNVINWRRLEDIVCEILQAHNRI